MRKPLPLALLSLSLLLPLPCLAFLSAESDQIGAPAAGGSALVSGALDGHSGNTDYQDYSLGGRLHYQAGVTGMFLAGEYNNARVNKEGLAENTRLHAGYQDEFQHALAAEAFVDFHKDNYRLLSNRTQVGVGPRFTLDYEPAERGVYAGLGLLHEWEDQADSNKHYWRLNSYVAYKRQLAPQTRVLFNAAWQPRLGNGSDFLASTEAALLVNLGGNADIKLGLRYSFDNRAPDTVKASDTQYSTSVSYRF